MNASTQEQIHNGYTAAGRAILRGNGTVAGIVVAYVAVFFGALPALLWSLGGRLDAIFALPRLAGAGWHLAGVVLAAAGFAWMIWAMALLGIVGRGLPISHLPPTRLVTTGPYRLSHHPIYAGYVTAMVGLALANGSPGRLLASALLVLGIVDYVLGIEGPALRQRFRALPSHYSPFSTVLMAPLRSLWMALRGPVEWLANRPVLARAGPTVWVTYGLFVALGAAISMSVALDRLATDGLTKAALVTYVLVLGPSMALGGRLLWFVVARDQVRRLGAWRALRTVGFVSWGAYIGFFAGSTVYAVTQGLNLLWLLDRTVPAALLCSVVGRIGCLTYGCCFGRAYPYGVRWYSPDSKVVRQLGSGPDVPRIPVQLLSAASTTLAVGVAAAASYRNPPAGAVTGVVMLLYAMGRFAVDSLRDESFVLGWTHGLNLGHVSSLLVVAVGLVLVFGARGGPAWPQPMTAFDWHLLAPMIPAVAVTTLLVFVVSGFQWRRVGQW
jgi:phosphatidylglycerol---prolipoprotein diacylglyceryl transferase